MTLPTKNIHPLKQEIIYPDSDGKPMADNTLQALWIVLLYSNLRALFSGKDVFVAADLLWYPVKGDPKTRVAPDVLVSFDRPEGYRGSYKQWEENDQPLTVVFEVISPSYSGMEMLKKRDFYEQYGVSEFIILDPQKNEFYAYVAKEGKLEKSQMLDGIWTSPKLGISIQLIEGELKAFYPDGSAFKLVEDLKEEKEALQVENKALQAEKEAALKAEKTALQEVELLKKRLRELEEKSE